MVLFGCFISSAVGSAVAARSAWTSWTGSVFTCGFRRRKSMEKNHGKTHGKPMGFTQYVGKNEDFSSNVWMSGCHSKFGQQQHCLITDVLLQKMAWIRSRYFQIHGSIPFLVYFIQKIVIFQFPRSMVLVYLPTWLGDFSVNVDQH